MGPELAALRVPITSVISLYSPATIGSPSIARVGSGRYRKGRFRCTRNSAGLE
ncbi:MAG: hypothetical protein U0X76_12105 [Bacteroidia bacterium]